MYQALIFDGSGERVHAGAGDTVLAAVQQATAHEWAHSNVGADVTLDDIKATTAYALPDDPNKRLYDQDAEALLAAAPFLIVWGVERMDVPLGVVRKL